MTDVKAADLPTGSLVRHQGMAIERLDGLRVGAAPWRGRDGSAWLEVEIDWLLAGGAEVLRHGYGGQP